MASKSKRNTNVRPTDILRAPNAPKQPIPAPLLRARKFPASMSDLHIEKMESMTLEEIEAMDGEY